LARRRKASGGFGGALGVAALAAAVLFKVIIGYWPIFAVAAVSYGVYRYYRNRAVTKPFDLPTLFDNPPPRLIIIEPSVPSPAASIVRMTVQERTPLFGAIAQALPEEELHSIPASRASAPAPEFKIPPAPIETTMARWVDKSETIIVAGITIRGAFLYLGANLHSPNGNVEPALIDVRKPVATKGHYSEPLTGYWPSYSEMSPQGRRAYLLWLADGRSAPDADIGYVFLYFYGLERRIIVDILDGLLAKDELPLLARELKRLYAHYAHHSDSFKMYCGTLLELVTVAANASKLYNENFDGENGSNGFPFSLRLAIGQAVNDGLSISPHIALAWVLCDPALHKRTPVSRCAKEFAKLFADAYVKAFGSGLKIAPNRTKLKLQYHPASAGLQGSSTTSVSFGDIPDFTVLTAPVKKLQAIVDSCTELLASYSRYLAGRPDGHNDLEAILLLPTQFWPEPARVAITAIKQKISTGFLQLTVVELFSTLNAVGELTKEKFIALAAAFETEGIGMEPDILGGARAINAEHAIVLFAETLKSTEVANNHAFLVGRISVEVAAAVAHSDGEFSDAELAHLSAYIDRWEHLSIASRQRLNAYARLLAAGTVSLSSLKKKVEPLDRPTREAIAAFAATMVLADGIVAPDEVRTLEKIYVQLGLDRTAAYSAIHAGHAANSPQSVLSQSVQADRPLGFTLDPSKIAMLKESSDRIAERLATIFAGDVEEPAAQQGGEPQVSSSVLGLDEVHSAFARVLITRESWQRAEALDVASDLNIMLDGALEKLNEASLDTLDTNFTDGDDPIDINSEIKERLTP
jgi:tellurite resistance protein